MVLPLEKNLSVLSCANWQLVLLHIYMPVDSEQDKKKKESSSPNVTFLCEYFYDLFIVVCVHEIFLKRRLFSAPCVAALVLSDGEQQ